MCAQQGSRKDRERERKCTCMSVFLHECVSTSCVARKRGELQLSLSLSFSPPRVTSGRKRYECYERAEVNPQVSASSREQGGLVLQSVVEGCRSISCPLSSAIRAEIARTSRCGYYVFRGRGFVAITLRGNPSRQTD